MTLSPRRGTTAGKSTSWQLHYPVLTRPESLIPIPRTPFPFGTPALHFQWSRAPCQWNGPQDRWYLIHHRRSQHYDTRETKNAAVMAIVKYITTQTPAQRRCKSPIALTIPITQNGNNYKHWNANRGNSTPPTTTTATAITRSSRPAKSSLVSRHTMTLCHRKPPAVQSIIIIGTSYRRHQLGLDDQSMKQTQLDGRHRKLCNGHRTLVKLC